MFYKKNPSYSAVHKRLSNHRGKASDYPCSFCGSPAQQWACINKTTDGFSNDNPVRYSLDIDDYIPACRSCNQKLDNPPHKKCAKGHSDWYTQGKQQRCRTCYLEWQKEKRKVKQ